ncbi:RibD family protein [Phaeovulum vinaykumarii]|uniref:5-amino-6-(5-phosphoribosylamino)uracil reductase n=1 Tax=Phaeovulum vinaykumarii TaxID=407234 RepID=A0A1N7M7E2_9RHOB|nr:dihydrofolate reductase family protein [Phaeovulum vinaykumarii]SIS81972.1 5-amino-6-(5-phosphoribosylamino)uracil reductase [Phaeovulum vinaykumarii]SOC11266.1 5-amino-6-(5-phosphoribosylamino)uracil reductase [Phaeovulum vinaykumarii]
MTRPHIICHMITTLDGRLVPDRWPWSEPELLEIYDPAAARLGADGWIAGRRTMAHYLPEGAPALADTPAPWPDHLAPRAGCSLGIAFDRDGRLRPESGDLDGDHLVLALSDRVARTHVADLAARGVSVVSTGPEGNDLSGALARIGAHFGVRRLLLEGGGTLNGAFLAADLIDETSTLIAPLIDGEGGARAIYDQPAPQQARTLQLISAETLARGTIWLRHRVQRR